MAFNLFRTPIMNWIGDRAMRQNPGLARAFDQAQEERGETRTGTISDYMPRNDSRGGVSAFGPRAVRRNMKRPTRG